MRITFPAAHQAGRKTRMPRQRENTFSCKGLSEISKGYLLDIKTCSLGVSVRASASNLVVVCVMGEN